MRGKLAYRLLHRPENTNKVEASQDWGRIKRQTTTVLGLKLLLKSSKVH